MKKILAVSGGVDSMVLMHMFRNDPEAVVAHFDHGMRESSADDAEFVEREASRVGLPFFRGSAQLGAGASEERARISRYEFFDDLARRLGGEICTAHHGDDLIETMAINLIRGTSWRGMAPFSREGVRRPFLETALLPTEVGGVIFRKDICEYAFRNNIVFRQDPTNTDERYLRNRVRILARNLTFEQKNELVKIYHGVNNLRTEIAEAVEEILGTLEKYPREWFGRLEEELAIELLREILMRAKISATRPQMLDFLRAIREYPAGRKFNLPGDRFAKIGTKDFFVLSR